MQLGDVQVGGARPEAGDGCEGRRQRAAREDLGGDAAVHFDGTARGQVADKVVGLKLGADDYVAKPFDMMELVARIEAQIRRSASATQVITAQQYAFGAVAVDFRKAEVRRDGVEIELSAREFQLLRYFIEHRGATLSRDELLNEVWGYNAMPSTRTVDVHVAWLRQKIEPNPRHPQYVLTVHGLGYKFVG